MNKAITSFVLTLIIVLFAANSGYASVTLSCDIAADRQCTLFLSENENDKGYAFGGASAFDPTDDFYYEKELTPGRDYYLNITLANFPNSPAGVIGDFSLSGTGFKFANGTQYLTTNSTDWKAYLNQWQEIDGVVEELAHDGEGYEGRWTYNFPDIDNNAAWISTDRGHGTYTQRFFYTKITAVTPEPATMSLLGLGLAGVLGFRRKRIVGNKKQVTRDK